LGVRPDDVTLEADLQNDLGADSLDMVEMLSKFQIEFHCIFPDEQQEVIRTIGDVVDNVKRTSILEWIRDGQAQPAKETVAPKATKTAQKAASQKPSAKETTVTLTNVPNGTEKPTVLNCGTITDAQKQDFLAAISGHKPSDNDGDNHACGFNVYYAKQSAVRVVSYDMPTDFQPVKKKIGKNELIVEMVPVSKKECGSWANYHCPICLASGDCTSPFIKKYIGEVLFPDKYAKQR
jgi:acyl carrier protein